MKKRSIFVLGVFILFLTAILKGGQFQETASATTIEPNSYIGFFNARGVDSANTYHIGYATSENKINWAKNINPILKPRSKMFDSLMLNGPCPVQVGNTIYVYYSGYNGTKWTIGLAIFDMNMNILYRSKNPVLDVGAFGSWDSAHVSRTSIFYDENSADPNKAFSMLYGGYSNGYYKIGLAYSPDGILWTKYVGNPVLSNGAAGEWDSMWASHPAVTYVDGTYYLSYNGYDGLKVQGGIATSLSLEGPWIKSGSNPIFKNRPGATQLLTSNVVQGSKIIKVSNASVFDLNEPCYLQCSSGTEIVRIKSRIDINTIELYEPVVLNHFVSNGARIESLLNKSVGPNQIEYDNGTWKVHCSVWANNLGYESTAYAEGVNLTQMQWNYCMFPVMDFNPIVTSDWDSMSQENLMYIKIN